MDGVEAGSHFRFSGSFIIRIMIDMSLDYGNVLMGLPRNCRLPSIIQFLESKKMRIDVVN